MNFLAHFFLSSRNEAYIAGALLGEFVRGRLKGRFAPDLEAAIRLHRRIDSFTDAHALHLRSRCRITGERRRYAGVIVDVAYDHILAVTWADYHPRSLESFATSVYAALRSRESDTSDHAPPGLIRRMQEHDWLTGYRRLTRIDRSLRGIAERRPRCAPIAGGIVDIRRNITDLNEDFGEFFPDLIEFVRSETGSGI